MENCNEQSLSSIEPYGSVHGVKVSSILLRPACLRLTLRSSKTEFYLRPFSPTLRSVYRSSELRDFHHLLLEKGIRVRIDLDPFLEGAEFSDVEMLEIEDGDEGQEALDVGEEVFAERQKLLPY